jgi:hypothetical protein
LLKPPLLAFATWVLAFKVAQQESIAALSQVAHLMIILMDHNKIVAPAKILNTNPN